MLELDEATRRALSRHYGPTPEAQARVLDELRGQLGPGGPGGGEQSPPEGGQGQGPPAGGAEQLTWVAKVVGATAGLTGAGLLVVKLGAMTLAGASPRSPTTTVEPPAASARASEPGESGEARSAPESPSAGREAVAASIGEVPQARERDPGPRLSTRADAKRGLAAELALLDTAQRLRTNDPEAALARLERHRREFPAGSLTPEREALRVELLCILGRHAQAARVREAFLATHDDPQLRARVEEGCARSSPGGD
jgi:hypothetical protein